jgi:hypothetical protein
VNSGFIWYVEKIMREKMIRVDTLFLSPVLPLPDVVRQMIVEGVVAVAFLSEKWQFQSQISLQVFDRKSGGSNVKFDGLLVKKFRVS